VRYFSARKRFENAFNWRSLAEGALRVNQERTPLNSDIFSEAEYILKYFFYYSGRIENIS
jgi:hypothetical protein